MAKGYVNLSETMRNAQFRGKPFLIIAALLVSGFLAFNFYSLSTQNNDLQNYIDSLKTRVEISSQTGQELENALGNWKKRYEETQHEIQKLNAELKKKDDVIETQAEESAMYRDKVRLAEAEIEKLKNSLSQKENEARALTEKVETLGAELAEKTEQISEGNLKLKEALDHLKELQEQGAVTQPSLSQSSSEKPVAAKEAAAVVLAPQPKSTSSTSKPVEQSQVLAKPGNDKEAEDLDQMPKRLPVSEGEDRVEEEEELEFRDVASDNTDDQPVKKTNEAEEDVPVLAVPAAENSNLGQAVGGETAVDDEEDKKVIDLPVVENKDTENLDKQEDEETNQDFEVDQADMENEQ